MTDDRGYASEGNTPTEGVHEFCAESQSIRTVDVSERRSLRRAASDELLETAASAASTLNMSRLESSSCPRLSSKAQDFKARDCHQRDCHKGPRLSSNTRVDTRTIAYEASYKGFFKVFCFEDTRVSELTVTSPLNTPIM